MLNAKDFRRDAWGKLKGKWGTAALIALIDTLIMAVCGALSYVYVGGIVSLLISGPLSLGISVVSLNIARQNAIEVNQLFGGFKNFGKAFLVNLLNGIFIVLWTLLFIIPGIVKTFSYSMSYYILADNPELSATEVRERSIELMRGNKWRLFCLEFSFIGWGILCVLTLGILSFWIIPYEQAAVAAFYRNLLPLGDEAHMPASTDAQA